MLLLAMAAGRATDTEPLIGQATYRFAAGDRITISVLGQSDFSDDFLLDSAGEISLPVVDAIPIRNNRKSPFVPGLLALRWP
jgi:protein involved in polysaccharide export with SLBB domain